MKFQQNAITNLKYIHFEVFLCVTSQICFDSNFKIKQFLGYCCEDFDNNSKKK